MATKVPAHSLAVFRILFGLLMAAAMLRFLANGWVDELFLQPRFHFPYPGFGWIRPWPGTWMHWHVLATAACALGVAAGFHYRVCIVLFFAGFTYLELIDQTTYLNHYYLISLVAGLMIFMPVHRAWSVDAVRKPTLRGEWVPSWTVNLLRFQFAMVYLFAGIAKLNADWLWKAQPLRIWLAARSDLPLIGPMLEETWVAYAASWFGAIYDLSVPFLLMFPRTRPLAFVAVLVFHLLTAMFFNIGMFPWIMIAGATLFFPPGWPRRNSSAPAVPPDSEFPAWGKGLLAVYIAAQLLIPVRGWIFGENSAWSGRGFNGAWKVMIVEKRGSTAFIAREGSKSWRIDSREYLSPRQTVMMDQDPYLIRDFARHLAEEFRERGHPDIEIRADSFASLNGRPSQRIIDSKVNLAGSLKPGWIIPLAEPPAPLRAAIPAAVLPPRL
jgi:vitamin K-dependent gamma-carboxylase